MLEKVNGICYKSMLDFGARNLNRHRKTVNKLNVFPVPDGDTGTNMVTTIKNGLRSIQDANVGLASVSVSFANAVVFGARGNSGVILSQFFRGLSEVFSGREEADIPTFIDALEKGVERAYESVANPVDGTILTVLKDASSSVRGAKDINSINELINTFIESAKLSLEHTPELLPTLKNAGVVDSGGAGVVYFFEGVRMYLEGEDIESMEESEEGGENIDYNSFDRTSIFKYGYCTELLIQLLEYKEPFDFEIFRNRLLCHGDSLALSHEGDKVRVHIHTHDPGALMSYCLDFGEFLFTKIENMTVQHTEVVKNILCAENKEECSFAVVAMAPDRLLQKTFIEMGADVVFYCDSNPSTKDFLDAMEKTNCSEIILFPNSSDSIFPAMQAGNLYREANVTVVNCKSVAECYASLAIIDYCESDTEAVIETVNETIENLEIITIAHATLDRTYGKKSIFKDDYYAFMGKELLDTGKTLDTFALKVIHKALMSDDEKCVMTIFHSRKVKEEQMEIIINSVREEYAFLEVCTVPTDFENCDLIISLE